VGLSGRVGHAVDVEESEKNGSDTVAGCSRILGEDALFVHVCFLSGDEAVPHLGLSSGNYEARSDVEVADTAYLDTTRSAGYRPYSQAQEPSGICTAHTALTVPIP
jgi:hypothetical protein